MHVSWKTPSQNQKDRFASGGHFRRERLTLEQVDQIKALEGRQRPLDVAKQFGTTQRNIRLIWAGKGWRDPSSKHRLFSDDEVTEIRRAPKDLSHRQVSLQYAGATMNQIARIRAGRSYAWVSEERQAD
jgi:hypothetical protein